MNTVPMEHGLILATVLFAVGLCGLVARRNAIFMLLSVEVLLNAAALVFVVADARWGAVDGQSMFLFILAMAASEVAVGLALIYQLYRHYGTLDTDKMRQLRE